MAIQQQGIKRRHQSGINLVELMIGVTVALILLAGIIAAVVNTNQGASDNLKAVKLNTQVRSAMDLIHRELQRAGYVDAWDANDDGNADDNGDGDVDINDLDWDAIEDFGQITLANCGAGGCSCILYSYDQPAGDTYLDGDGVQDATDIFAIRLNNGAIQIGFSANLANCAANTWQSITDAEIIVTALTFNLAAEDHAYYGVDPADPAIPAPAAGAPFYPAANCATSGHQCLERRKIDVAITAELATDSNVTVQINDQIKVQNDWFYTVP